MVSDVSMYEIPNGVQTVTVKETPNEYGDFYQQTENRYDNGMCSREIIEKYGDSYVEANIFYFSTGEAEFIETRTDKNEKVVSKGTYDSDFNLTSIKRTYYQGGIISKVLDDCNGDGNYEYQAYYNDGDIVSAYDDYDSDGFIEYEKHYNPDGTVTEVDNRSFLEKCNDFFSELF